MPVESPSADPAVVPDFDASRPWGLHPQVSLRPEAFGALAYHFGTRRLSFLKSPELVSVVEALATQPTAEHAVRAAGVPAGERARYRSALATLARTGMIAPRADP
jgi:putative mycofactocin binding protein MftB